MKLLKIWINVATLAAGMNRSTACVATLTAPHCADFWDDGCDEWEGGLNDFVQGVGW